jgi:hypothetical protein
MTPDPVVELHIDSNKVLRRALADTQDALKLVTAALAETGHAPELIEGARRVLRRYGISRG